MQKQKTGKFSIFSSLDVKLKFLTNRVELIQFSVESSRVELKIWATRLESSWKCEQLDFESSRIQNVNSKLDLMISLDIMHWNLKMMWSWVHHAIVLFFEAVLAFASTLDENTTCVSHHCAQTMNAVTASDRLISIIYHASALFETCRNK